MVFNGSYMKVISSDIQYNPVFISYSIIEKDKVRYVKTFSLIFFILVNDDKKSSYASIL